MTTFGVAQLPGVSRPKGRLYTRLQKAVHSAALPVGDVGPPVTNADIADLPAVAQRYLRFMGVVGKPRDWSFRGRFQGRFLRRPGGPWLPADAWQYDLSVEPSRIYAMRLLVGHVVPFQGLDTYLHGQGRMVGTLFGKKVVDGSGDEFDHSEFVIYLNDLLLMAPSMLLASSVRWTAVDDSAFDVAISDHGRTVSGRVFVDERGAITDFVADRYATLPEGLVLAPWRTPIHEWLTVGGRAAPGQASVIYDLPTGPFCYFEGRFDPGSIAYNVSAWQL